ncbi:uncharacterized Zn finger protein (UPF0148 family) [Dysgonomonas sp. PH5-45]|uniref:hypothetical protein n=1 Tax=unclassified Dysgonomonas TaxID=2630389 RepID=UPI002472FAF0|nr:MULTISPECIES: hypothetical protein [unclassified Dysgonomonas]MDH6355034.1 uncharacterized Zn finger protein (UPF0148 family) [Dysgonomonas sp. PH5-45]MDH6387934.1 uncharacterized Zn finger protein (UPF0148 family) [Dysgonomonas sp. PH5-37]
MSDHKCPLCGKPVDDEGIFCNNCQEAAKNRSSDFLASVTVKEETLDEQIQAEEPPTPPVDEPEQEAESHDSDTGTPPPTKKKDKKPIAYFIACGLLLIVGLGAVAWVWNEKRTTERTENDFWESRIKENTPLEYSKYLIQYPEGKFADEAEKRIKSLRQKETDDWTEVKKSSDINLFYSFLNQYPDSPFKDEAHDIMDSLCWNETQKTDTPDSYQAYIDNISIGNITGKYIELAKSRHKYLSTLVTLEGTALDSVKTVLTDFFQAVSDAKTFSIAANSTQTLSVFLKNENVNAGTISEKVKAEVKDKKLKESLYQPSLQNITVIRDSAGIYRTDIKLTVTQRFKDKKKKDVHQSYNTSVTLNPEKKIQVVAIK